MTLRPNWLALKSLSGAPKVKGAGQLGWGGKLRMCLMLKRSRS